MPESTGIRHKQADKSEFVGQQNDYFNYRGISYRQDPVSTKASRKIQISVPVNRPFENGTDPQRQYAAYAYE